MAKTSKKSPKDSKSDNKSSKQDEALSSEDASVEKSDEALPSEQSSVEKPGEFDKAPEEEILADEAISEGDEFTNR